VPREGDAGAAAGAEPFAGFIDLGGWTRRGVPSSVTTQLPVDASTVRSMHAEFLSTGEVRADESAACPALLATNKATNIKAFAFMTSPAALSMTIDSVPGVLDQRLLRVDVYTSAAIIPYSANSIWLPYAGEKRKLPRLQTASAEVVAHPCP
jgi:hypothetical protein